MSDSQFAERMTNLFPFFKCFAMLNQVAWETLVFKKQVIQGEKLSLFLVVLMCFVISLFCGKPIHHRQCEGIRANLTAGCLSYPSEF